jgi:hypothetical protein
MPSYHWRETAVIVLYSIGCPFSLMRMPWEGGKRDCVGTLAFRPDIPLATDMQGRWGHNVAPIPPRIESRAKLPARSGRWVPWVLKVEVSPSPTRQDCCGLG